MKPAERWAPVAGWEDSYEVSDHGRVRSVARTCQSRHWRSGETYERPVRSRILRPLKSSAGYLQVCLSRSGKVSRQFIHRLVAMAFLPNPGGHSVVNHLDGNKENCRHWNLEWTDARGNNAHALATGLSRPTPQKFDESAFRVVYDSLVSRLKRVPRLTELAAAAETDWHQAKKYATKQQLAFTQRKSPGST